MVLIHYTNRFVVLLVLIRTGGASVSMATAWVRFPTRTRDFPVLHSVPTCSATNRASYIEWVHALFAGLMLPEREAECLSVSNL
jgi:hypothetical protein